MRHSSTKSEATVDNLWETQTKTAKNEFLTIILSSPTFFFEITNSKNLEEYIFLVISSYLWF